MSYVPLPVASTAEAAGTPLTAGAHAVYTSRTGTETWAGSYCGQSDPPASRSRTFSMIFRDDGITPTMTSGPALKTVSPSTTTVYSP